MEKNSRKTVKETGRITNYVGRIRHLDKVKRIYGEHGDDILNWRYRNEWQDTTLTHKYHEEVLGTDI